MYVFPVLLVVPRLDICLFGRGEETLGSSFHGIDLGFVFRVGAWFVGFRWVGDEEGVLHVTGGMLLWDEKSIEVPEAGVDEAITKLVTV